MFKDDKTLTEDKMALYIYGVLLTNLNNNIAHYIETLVSHFFKFAFNLFQFQGFNKYQNQKIRGNCRHSNFLFLQQNKMEDEGLKEINKESPESFLNPEKTLVEKKIDESETK